MRQFLIIGKGKGTYGTNNPINEFNLLELGSASPSQPRLSKPERLITVATYKSQPDDKDFWLRFTHLTSVYHIADDMFSPDDEIEGELYGSTTSSEASLEIVGNDPAGVEPGNVTIRVAAGYQRKFEKNGVFGIKFKNTGDCVLFGSTLPTFRF